MSHSAGLPPTVARGRRWLAFLLSFLLLFAQQALLAHPLEHLHAVAAQTDAHDNEHPAPQHACEKCMALAPYTGAVAASSPSLTLAEFGNALLPTPQTLSAGTRRLTLKNRGPPANP